MWGVAGAPEALVPGLPISGQLSASASMCSSLLKQRSFRVLGRQTPLRGTIDQNGEKKKMIDEDGKPSTETGQAHA